jgi:cytochrome c-type biogenesis protein CcmF
MVIDIKDKTRNARSFGAGLKRLQMGYWGMQLAHLGILLSVMGIAITTSLSIEKDIAMQKNQSVEVQGYQFTMVATNIIMLLMTNNVSRDLS